MFAPHTSAQVGYVGRAGWREATMTTLEFVALFYIALCVGATIGYVIAGLLANANRH